MRCDYIALLTNRDQAATRIQCSVRDFIATGVCRLQMIDYFSGSDVVNSLVEPLVSCETLPFAITPPGGFNWRYVEFVQYC